MPKRKPGRHTGYTVLDAVKASALSPPGAPKRKAAPCLDRWHSETASLPCPSCGEGGESAPSEAGSFEAWRKTRYRSSSEMYDAARAQLLALLERCAPELEAAITSAIVAGPRGRDRALRALLADIRAQLTLPGKVAQE